MALTKEQIARVSHEVNRAYCQAIGDNSQPPWENAPAWQRDSVAKGVQFHIENPNAGPAVSHESWMKHKLSEGWKYGPKKRPDRKEHFCLVPFDQLPPAQQTKDHLFQSVVRTLISLNGECGAVG